jgi:hypothetical protein
MSSVRTYLLIHPYPETVPFGTKGHKIFRFWCIQNSYKLNLNFLIYFNNFGILKPTTPFQKAAGPNSTVTQTVMLSCDLWSGILFVFSMNETPKPCSGSSVYWATEKRSLQYATAQGVSEAERFHFWVFVVISDFLCYALSFTVLLLSSISILSKQKKV